MRSDNFEYNKLKFFSYIIKNYNEFNFNKIIETIALKKLNTNLTKSDAINDIKKRTLEKPFDFIDCMMLGFADIYKIDHNTKRLKKTFLDILEYTFSAYCLVQKLPKKYLEQNIILPKQYNTDLIKNLFKFLCENKYLIFYERDNDNIVCHVLKIGQIKNLNKLFKENYQYSNLLNVSIFLLSSNFCTISVTYENREIQEFSGVANLILQKIEGQIPVSKAIMLDANTSKKNYNAYIKTIKYIYSLINTNTTTKSCFLCDPTKDKSRCCDNCNLIVNLFHEISRRQPNSIKRSLINLASKKERYEYLVDNIYKYKKLLRNNKNEKTKNKSKQIILRLESLISRIYGTNL